MPFVRFDIDFVRETWVREFAAHLNVPWMQAVGHLVALYSAMVKERPDGAWQDLPIFLLAEYAEWPGAAALLASALKQAIQPANLNTQLPGWESINQPQREAFGSAVRQARKRSRDKKVTPKTLFSNASFGDKTALEVFNILWAEYPKRAGGNSKPDAFTQWVQRVNEGVTPEDLLAGVMRYRRYCDATGTTGTQYVKQAATFLGKGEHWKDEYKIPQKNGKTAPQVYSYEQTPKPSPPSGEPGRYVTRAGYAEPVLVGRQGSLEITEPDEAPEPEPSPYGKRVE